ncbi:MAG: DUF4278 domain-containing protein [Bacteroidetes bacterium]|nr:MAG: DUF4278 domain-containing protein [Bacteroidota bacterium]
MERSIKYLYYRGVRYVSNIISEQKTNLKNLSYRGANILSSAAGTVVKSTQPHMYRGVAY